MNYVEMFSCAGISDLEKLINNFLITNKISDVIDIKFISGVYNNFIYFSAMIIYKV